MKRINIGFLVIVVLIMAISLYGCQKPSYKIYFETNGASQLGPVETDGSSIVELPHPVREGYVFSGWFYDNYTFRNQFFRTTLINNSITEDITLYAKWMKDLSPTEGLVYSETDDGYEIIGYTGDSKDVVIPPTHNDLHLVGVAEQAFMGQEIESVIISDSVEQIGEAAFKDCESLESITLPFVGRMRGLSNTYDSVFGYIFGYTDDFFEGFLQTRQDFDSENYFYYYIPSSLKEVILTETNRIPYGAFSNCGNISKIEIPDSVLRIDERAFYNCSDLGFMIVPRSVSRIDKDAFLNSQHTTIYCEIESKPSYWSSSWISEENIVYWGVEAHDVGEYQGLQYFILDNSIEITRYFGDSDNVTIPETIIDRNVISIKSKAFKNSNVISVDVPDTVQNIGFSAFEETNNLNSLKIPFTGASLSAQSNTHFGYIFGAGSATTNYNYAPASLKKVEITKGQVIKENAFLDCAYIEEIILPQTLEEIEGSAFRNCLSLVAIDIPQSVNIIGNSILNGCESLESIILPNQLSSMGTGVFYDCVSLKNAQLPINITKIPNNTFFGCAQLEEISLPLSVAEIGISAFEGCEDLVEVSLPESVNKIDSRAFYGCQQLEDINIPENLTIIADSVFRGCISIQSLYIPYSVFSIGMWAFRDCENLTIYAERDERPSGWVDQWNFSDCPVVWSYES